MFSFYSDKVECPFLSRQVLPKVELGAAIPDHDS